MTRLSSLPTLDHERSIAHAIPKTGNPTKARKAVKRTKGNTLIDAVWDRDHDRSRASGKPLDRKGPKFGHVHHVDKRSTHPETKFDPKVCVLLSEGEHSLAETRCTYDPTKFFLEIEGPKDRGLPQTFTWREPAGAALRIRSEKRTATSVPSRPTSSPRRMPYSRMRWAR